MKMPPPSLALDDPRPLVLTAFYWSSHALLQRVSGGMGMHSGRAYPVTVAVGLCFTAVATLSTQICTNVALRVLASTGGGGGRLLDWGQLSMGASDRRSWWAPDVFLGLSDGGSSSSSSRFLAKHAIVSMSLHAVLERRAFRAVLPSSLLAVGAFAPNTVLHPFTSGVRATSAVATAPQRAVMQRLGTIHGCHHCGNRQGLRRLPFIADHMPPTKTVLEANSRWYRRLPWLPLPANQQLLPQCQTCFGQQGGAVRAGIHRLAYGQPLRTWHFAPALAYVLLENRLLGGAAEELLDDLMDSGKAMCSKLGTWLR